MSGTDNITINPSSTINQIEVTDSTNISVITVGTQGLAGANTLLKRDVDDATASTAGSLVIYDHDNTEWIDSQSTRAQSVPAKLYSLIFTSGGATVTGVLDEDNLGSNSNTKLATQQSIKAYVDAQVTAQDLDFQGDSGGALSIDLDSETFTVAGGTGIDTVGGTNTITVSIDSTVATLSGSQTLTNKVLTSPDVNAPDIDGGTIDGATIATSNITVGSGKTLDVSGGTLTLADNQISGDKVEGGTIASTTITSLASTTVDATNIEVTNIKAKDGTAAGSIADSTGVVTLASSVLTTTDINGGTIDATNITVGSGKTLDVSGGTLTLANDQISGDKIQGGTVASMTITAMTGTLQTAAQPNVTSLGTLSALTVDDIALDAKTLTMTGSSGDTATLVVGTNGTLDITTTDASAAAANIQITADGTAELAGTTVTLDSSGGITLDADGGTITFADGGSSLGTITSSGYTGNVVGNASTATALATARTIGGTSFDGTANISVALADTATALATARTIHGVSFDGTANIDLSEVIADTVGAMFSSNTETNITATYQDSDNTIDLVIGTLNQDTTGTADNFTVTANNSTDETVYPIFVDGATGSQGAETDTGLSYNPSSGNLTIGGALVAATLDISGNVDVDGTLEADAYTVNGTALNEFIADTVGAMVSSNTETNVTVTYEDSDNTLDFVVGTLNQDTTGNAATATALETARNIALAGDVTGTASFDGTGNISITSTIAANSVALGTDTTGNYVATVAGTTNEIEVSGSGSESAGVTIGLPDDVTIGNDLTVTGDLTVNGDTVTLNTATLDVEDATIRVAKGATTLSNTNGAGIEFGASSSKPTITWDNGNTRLSANKVFAATSFVGNVAGNATTATTLATARTIGGTSFDGSANISVALADTATALATARTIGGTSFDGTANIDVALATLATNVTVSANNSTDETVYPLFVDGATGTQGAETDTGLTYNPSTGMLTSTGFTGALTGNASTATTLATARNIGGTSFDGSADIAVALAATATALATARTIHGVSFDGTANIDLSEVISDTVGAMFSSNTESGITATYQDSDNTIDLTVGTLNQDTTGNAGTFTVTANNSTDETVYPVFVDGATGAQGAETDTGLTYNPSSGNLTIAGELAAATLDISGNVDIDGTLEADAITVNGTTLAETISDTVGAMVSSNTESGITVTYQDSDNTLDFSIGTLNQDTTGTAAIATTVTVTDNESTNEDNAIIFAAGGDVDGGNLGLESDGTLTYNPSTGKITATGFIGALTGNADTATTLANARTIHGVSFDGSANIDLSEVICDTVGAMFSSNTETGITATYQDADNTIDLVIGTLNQNTTGNAATATALATARTIGGVSFDGTANIDLLATDIKIGEDDQTKIDFETADEIHFYAANAEQVYIADGIFGAQTDNDVDLGASGVEFKDLYLDGTAHIDTLDVDENATVAGTLGVTGDFTVDTNVLMVDVSTNRVGIGNASPDVSLDIGSFTDAVHLPVGTTAQRPTGAAGYLRYNSTLSRFEGYTDAWGEIGGGGTSTLSVNTYTVDTSGANPEQFTLSQAPASTDNTIVFIEGVYQNPNSYSVSGTTLTLDTEPENGRKVVVYHVSNAVSGQGLNIDQFTANGSTTAFTLTVDPSHENNTNVFLDGVYQQKTDYAVSGTTLTMDTAPANGAILEVQTFTMTEINTFPATGISNLTLVTPVAGDHMMILDATDNALKKADVKDIMATAVSITSSADAVAMTFDSSENATFAGNIIKGNLTISGTEIDLSSGDLTIDVAGDLILDAGGDDFRFDYGGTTHLYISNNSGNTTIQTAISDEDLVFKGNDGGSTITALTLDMSESGRAYFNSRVGINTTSPDTMLHINGAANSEQVIITGNGNSGRGLSIQTAASGGQQDAGVIFDAQDTESGANPYIQSKLAGANYSKLSGTGNEVFMDIFSDSGTNRGGGYFRFRTDGASADQAVAQIYMEQGSGDGNAQKCNMYFQVSDNGNPSTAMTIANNKSVGIGTTSPSHPLHIVESADGTKIRLARDGVCEWDFSIGNSSTLNGVGSGALELLPQNANTANEFAIGQAGTTTALFHLTNSGATFSGSLSKGSGSFKIDHPLEAKKDTHHLVHSFVEAPQADNIYRGKVALSNGTATVNIDTEVGMTDGTFVALNRDVQCFTTNETDWDAVKGSVSGNILTITCQNSSSTATVSWIVIGERQDQHIKDTDWTDANGKVILEPLKAEEG